MVRAIAVAALAATLSGCSFAMVKKPPNLPPSQFRPANYVGCTTSMTIPNIDLAISTIASAVSWYDISDWDEPLFESDVLNFGVPIAGLAHLIGWMYGFAHVKNCQRFMARPPRYSGGPPAQLSADISWWPQEWKGRPMIPTR